MRGYRSDSAQDSINRTSKVTHHTQRSELSIQLRIAEHTAAMSPHTKPDNVRQQLRRDIVRRVGPRLGNSERLRALSMKEDFLRQLAHPPQAEVVSG